jgi:hypothetical protein
MGKEQRTDGIDVLIVSGEQTAADALRRRLEDSLKPGSEENSEGILYNIEARTDASRVCQEISGDKETRGTLKPHIIVVYLPESMRPSYIPANTRSAMSKTAGGFTGMVGSLFCGKLYGVIKAPNEIMNVLIVTNLGITDDLMISTYHPDSWVRPAGDYKLILENVVGFSRLIRNAKKSTSPQVP